MGQALQIQNIEELRRQAGIDDVELRVGIRSLSVGDCVRLSLMTRAHSFDTVQVRITTIRGSTFHGKLTSGKIPPVASAGAAGMSLSFSAANIHSIVKKELPP